MKVREKTRVEVAQDLANTGWIRRQITTALARCHATGLDPDSYEQPLTRVGQALAEWFTPTQVRRARPYRKDTDYAAALVCIEEDLLRKLYCLEHAADEWAWLYAYAYGRHCTAIMSTSQHYWWTVMNSAHEAWSIVENAYPLVSAALGELRGVYDQLEDTYQAAYDLVRAGRVLPFDGRWITGEPVPVLRRVARAASNSLISQHRSTSKAR